MKRFIILLRGIMPVGKNRVPMAELRVLLEKAGLKNVRTYIASGNVIADTALSPVALQRLVHDVIQKNFGGDIVTIARTVPQIRKVLAGNPYPGADLKKMYYTIFASKPDARLLREFIATDFSPDRLTVTNGTAYILCNTKYSDTLVNNPYIEKTLKIRSTTRIHATLAALVSMAGEDQ